MLYRAPGKRLVLRHRLLQFTIHALCCCPLLLLAACASSGGSTQVNQSTTPTPSPAATSTSMPTPTLTPATCTQTVTPTPSTLQVAYCGHAGPVIGVAWSPDSKRIVSGTGAAGNYGPVTSNNSVKVWDAATGQTLLTYTGSSGQVYALAWSPDGKWIASAGDDKSVHIWNAATGQTLTQYHGQTNIIFDVAWSPDGSSIASASADGSVDVWRFQA